MEQRPLVNIGGIAHELPMGDTVAGVPGSSAWIEPMTVWNNGSPEILLDGEGDVVMGNVS